MEQWFIPYTASELPIAKRVLVIAPHPDDEVFGCGGAIALYRQNNIHVQVLVLTNGVALAPASEQQILSATRMAETQRALSILNVDQKDVLFLALADRSLISQAQLTDRLREAMRGTDVVLAPSYTEIHPDHAASGQAVCDALRLWSFQDCAPPTLLLYEVGAPLLPNFLLDISSVWTLKRQAMQCFESQLKLQNYAKHIEGLNTYRTYTLKTKATHAEAYKKLGVADIPLIHNMEHERAHGQLAACLKAAEVQTELSLQAWSSERNVLLENIRDLQNSKSLLDARIEKLTFELRQASVFGNTKEREIQELQNLARSQQRLLESAEEEKVELDSKLHSTQAQKVELERSLIQVSSALNTVLNSRTWRWTRVLRLLGQWLAGRSAR